MARVDMVIPRRVTMPDVALRVEEPGTRIPGARERTRAGLRDVDAVADQPREVRERLVPVVIPVLRLRGPAANLDLDRVRPVRLRPRRVGERTARAVKRDALDRDR